MKRTLYVVVGMTVVSCLALAGCKKAAEKAAEKAIEANMAKEGVKAKVDASGGKVTIESKDGTATYAGGKGTKVPDNFPKDVYIYDGATVSAAVTAPEGFNLVMETGDNADKVMSAIQGKMAGMGWKQEMTLNQGKSQMVGYKKGDRSTMVHVVADDKRTMITVTVSEKKKG